MSRWDQIKQRSKEMGDQAKAKAGQFKNKNFADGSMAMCALIAAADGSVDADERSKVSELIASNEALSIFPTNELQQRFDEYCNKLVSNYDVGKVELVQVVAKLKSKEDQARAVVQIGCVIGQADGQFDDNERQTVREVCFAVGLNPAEFGV